MTIRISEMKCASHWISPGTIPTNLKIDQYLAAGFNTVMIAEIRYNSQKTDFNDIFAGRNGWTQAANPIVTFINYMHSKGANAAFVMNPGRYGDKATFFSRTADVTQFKRDVAYLVSKGIDYIEIEEPTFTLSVKASVTAFFKELRALIPAPKLLTFNTPSNTRAGMESYGFDLPILDRDRVFDAVMPQPGKDATAPYLITNERRQTVYTGWTNPTNGLMPNTFCSPYLYVQYSVTGVPGPVQNVNLIPNTQQNVSNGWGVMIRPMDLASDTIIAQLKQVLGGRPEDPVPPGYVLKLEDHFTSPLSGWSLIWNNPSAFNVANSLLTITIPSGTTPAWMRRTDFTWKYGLLRFRAKFPKQKGAHAGIWAYKNNGVPCANNPSWQSQDSVNFETAVSKDTWGERVAGHLTSNFGIWSAEKCNQFKLFDTPYDGDAFHNYEIEWTPTAVICKKDGIEQVRFTTGIPTQALDLNIGIDCLANAGACAGIQWMDKTIEYPVIMQVDSIQLYQKDTPPPTTGNINLKTTPVTGVTVYLDNVIKGVSDLLIENIPAGSHTILLKKEGYNDLTQTVNVIAGQVLMLTLNMVLSCVPTWVCETPLNGYEKDGCGNRRQNSACIPVPGKGTLNVVSVPPGAKITINGVDSGTAPFSKQLLPDHYAVVASLSGYPDIFDQFDIAADQTIIKVYTFKEEPKSSSSSWLIPLSIAVGVMGLIKK